MMGLIAECCGLRIQGLKLRGAEIGSKGKSSGSSG